MTGAELKEIMTANTLKPIDVAVGLGVSVQTVYNLMKREELETLFALAIRQFLTDSGRG